MGEHRLTRMLLGLAALTSPTMRSYRVLPALASLLAAVSAGDIDNEAIVSHALCLSAH